MGTKETMERNWYWFHSKFKDAFKTDKILSKKMLLAQIKREMYTSHRTALEVMKDFETFGIIRVEKTFHGGWKDRIEVLK